MNSTKSGSALLVVVCISTVFLIFYASMWQATVYMVDIAIERYQYEQKKYLIESFMRYVCRLSMQKFEEVMHCSSGEQPAIRIDFGPIVINHAESIIMSAWLKEESMNQLAVTVEVQYAMFPPMCGRYILKKLTDQAHDEGKKSYQISQWYAA